MLSRTASNSKKEFIKLLLEAHTTSGRSFKEIEFLCGIDSSYISYILRGFRHPSRDILIALCWKGWNLDIFDADNILKAGGYKTILDWKKAGWESLVNDSQQKLTNV